MSREPEAVPSGLNPVMERRLISNIVIPEYQQSLSQGEIKLPKLTVAPTEVLT